MRALPPQPSEPDDTANNPSAHEALTRGFTGLEDASRLLLAVSGGPDSMAMMHLAARWAAAEGKRPAIEVATIDHGLRPEGRQEAEMAAAAAAALGLNHTILTWEGPKPASGIQEKAREARYTLLVAHAAKIGATHVLTAHHLDDQAETVLLRLGRGSGVAGLAGMRRQTALAPQIDLIRPLLDVPKTDLVAYCRHHAIGFAEDPSNQDTRYTRARLRAEAMALAKLGLDPPALARLARRMARADAALDAETDRIEAMLQPIHADGTCRVDLTAARLIAPEIAIRLLHRFVAHTAHSPQIRLERLEALAEALWAALAEGRAHRGTLGGALVRLGRDGRLDVSPEPLRRRGRPLSH